MHDQGGPVEPGITHVRQPFWFGEGRDQHPDAFGNECAAAIETRILELGEDKVAASIAEPGQGAGVAIIPPESYWPAPSNWLLTSPVAHAFPSNSPPATCAEISVTRPDW